MATCPFSAVEVCVHGRCSCGGINHIVPTHDLKENRLYVRVATCIDCQKVVSLPKLYLVDCLRNGSVLDVNGIYFQGGKIET